MRVDWGAAWAIDVMAAAKEKTVGTIPAHGPVYNTRSRFNSPFDVGATPPARGQQPRRGQDGAFLGYCPDRAGREQNHATTLQSSLLENRHFNRFVRCTEWPSKAAGCGRLTVKPKRTSLAPRCQKSPAPRRKRVCEKRHHKDPKGTKEHKAGSAEKSPSYLFVPLCVFATCILNGHINNLNKRIARDRGILEAGV